MEGGSRGGLYHRSAQARSGMASPRYGMPRAAEGPVMEPRLLIAYALIALIVAAAAILILRERQRRRRARRYRRR